MKVDEYLKLKAQVKSQGFKLLGTESNETYTFTSYRKGNHEVVFQTSYNVDYKMYAISLRDKVRQNKMLNFVNNLDEKQKSDSVAVIE
jgi:hypothetical protein